MRVRKTEGRGWEGHEGSGASGWWSPWLLIRHQYSNFISIHLQSNLKWRPLSENIYSWAIILSLHSTIGNRWEFETRWNCSPNMPIGLSVKGQIPTQTEKDSLGIWSVKWRLLLRRSIVSVQTISERVFIRFASFLPYVDGESRENGFFVWFSRSHSTSSSSFDEYCVSERIWMEPKGGLYDQYMAGRNAFYRDTGVVSV